MMRLHHIGVACRDIEAEIEKLSQIHGIAARTEVVHDSVQDASLALLTMEDGTRIELVAGPRVETLVRKNIGLYHLCFEVVDLGAEIDRLVSAGAKLLAAPAPAVLFQGCEVAFLYVSYGIVELLSQNPV
ncbi:MAG TPA: VOC family protein [Puia sp.]|nr:VOC family protein [Puia sp.]